MEKQKQNNYTIEAIQKRVAEEIKRPVKTLEDLELFLAKWWCRHYNKPYKCAEIKEYTLEELIYEYFDIQFHMNPEALEKAIEGQKQEEGEDENWMKKMMGDGYMSRKEQEEALKEVKKELAAEEKFEKDIDFKFERFI